MYDLYYEAYDKFRGIGNTGTLLYADAGPPQGTNGDWNHGINLLDGLSGKYRGRALIDYAQDQRDSLIPATGTHNSSAVRGMVLITDGSTTYNGEPVEEINFLTGIAGAGGNPAIMQKFVHLITEQSTPIPLSLHDEGDLLLFYVGVDRGENVNANCTFGVAEGWTKVANIQSGSDEFRTEGWLWAKVAGATEALPTLTLDGSPPVSQHGQGIMVVLKNVNSVIGTASTYATSANSSNSWGPLTGPTLTDANELVVFFGTDRRPKQPWTITPSGSVPALTDEVNNASGSLGNSCTTYFGHVQPGAVGPMGDFTVGFNRPDGNYRPHLIAAVLGKV